MKKIETNISEKEKTMERFWVSLAGVIIVDSNCLILELSGFPGKWDIPGGRVEIEENHEEAFYRELEEEIGLVNIKNIMVIDYDLWYTTDRHLPVCAIAHLVSTNSTKVRLSDEHLDYKWITQDEIKNYNYIWPNTGRMIEKGFEKYNELNKISNK